jgi:hypothetical protein
MMLVLTVTTQAAVVAFGAVVVDNFVITGHKDIIGSFVR